MCAKKRNDLYSLLAAVLFGLCLTIPSLAGPADPGPAFDTTRIPISHQSDVDKRLQAKPVLQPSPPPKTGQDSKKPEKGGPYPSPPRPDQRGNYRVTLNGLLVNHVTNRGASSSPTR